MFPFVAATLHDPTTETRIAVTELVTESIGILTIDPASKTVHFAHNDTRELITEVQSPWRLDLIHVHHKIASTLAHEIWKSSHFSGLSKGRQDTRHRTELLYAAKWWAYHGGKSEDPDWFLHLLSG